MLLRRVEGYGIQKSWTSFDQISANLVRAVIASEDSRFCNHHGFDWNAIETARDRYRSRRGRLLGASTISMQTAKNVFLWPGRDWVRKAFEAYFTVLIEIAWGKQRIMEVYLNVVEWGQAFTHPKPPPGTIFTGRPAAALTVGEAVPLAAVLPDPLNWSPLRLTPRCDSFESPGCLSTPSPPCSRENRPGLGLR
jgi:monofunctional glycosyltransferase